MKKRVLIFVLVWLTVGIFAGSVNAETPTVILNGQRLSFDVPPTIEDGRTLVPLRAIFEAMGATVTWNQNTQTATAVKGDTTVILKIGSTIPSVNGQVKQLDIPAKIVNGRTLAPLRFVSEAFGSTVKWDSDFNIITICSNNTEPIFNQSGEDTIKYQWGYKGIDWEWDLNITQDQAREIIERYRKLPRPRRTPVDYVLAYCTGDNVAVETVAQKLKQGADNAGYDKYQTVEYVIAFVQGFEYVSDKLSTGYDEYPRYPSETLLEQGGDCEDTAILTAVLLRQLGFGSALIFFDNHCAVGLKGSDTVKGYYFTVEDTRYYYVETTAPGWPIGVMPDLYKNKKALVLPLP